MNCRSLTILLLLVAHVQAMKAQATADTVPRRRGVVAALYRFVKGFSQVDTAYVEPQRYNLAGMAQNTNTYEVYRMRSGQGHDFVFSPKPSVKLGPYFGWRWIFLGYTFDISHLRESNHKQDLNLSLYSNQIGVDIFYRKTGDDYKIRSIDLGDGIDTSCLKDLPFDGISASIKGFNLYYIFNHRKFSYPAAYSQSTVQRRSAGSFLAGIGYTRHSLDVDWQKLSQIVERHTGHGLFDGVDPQQHLLSRVKYSDYSISGGYAYNWVFAHNWLLDASLSLALAYKVTEGDSRNSDNWFRSISLNKFNMDGITRIGVVWNNTRWFAGANAIFHSYNYRKSQFSTNNTFGSVNIYVGLNFDRR